MQVSNNSYNKLNTITSKQEVTNENTSFDSIFKNINKIEKPEEKGKYLEYVDSFNYLDFIASKDRQVIRDILRDDKVTLKEMDSITFEQAQILSRSHLPLNTGSMEIVNNSPLVDMSNQIHDMLLATNFTPDKSFNKALYNALRDIDDDSSRSTLLHTLERRISQLISEQTGKEVNNKVEWDFKKVSINFSTLLDDILEVYEEELKKPQNKPKDYLKQQRDELNLFYNLKHHYNNILKEGIYL